MDLIVAVVKTLANAVEKLSDLLGLWRIDVAIYNARARRYDTLAAELEAEGWPKGTAEVRELADKYRKLAEERAR